MRAISVSCVVLIAVGVGLLAPASASATCGDCYWANYAANKANQYAQSGLNHETGCDTPWGGGENAVAVYLGYALDDGEDAESLLWQAYQTCSCSAASQALSKLSSARDAAESAVSLCGTEICEDNEACPYAGSALSWYEAAILAAEDCYGQACGASSMPQPQANE